MDLDYLEALITPRTRLLIYNNCQNPLGTESSAAEMQRVAELAVPAQPVGAVRRSLL
jgi:aspartate/methionine/tyrosine aminotransferase